MHLQHLTAQRKDAELGVALDQCVRDSDGFSLAHPKELFIAVAVPGDGYEQAIATSRATKEAIWSEHNEEDRAIGFAARQRRTYVPIPWRQNDRRSPRQSQPTPGAAILRPPVPRG
jgi:hypothetical protein